MEITLAGLKEMVDEMVEEYGEEKAEDVVVRWAAQPAWPFEYSINLEWVTNTENNVIYFAEEKQLGYLPGEIKDQLGW